MKKFFLPFVSLLLLSVVVHAQYNLKENNVWALGHRAGLDFNSGSAVPVETNILTNFGSASVCDANGALLFYTNGDSVWNKNGQVMPNATNLIKPYSAAFGTTLIVPFIGDSNRYYVFSLGSPGDYIWGDIQAGRLFYSVVDMSLDNGNGAVATGMKGIPLDSALTGKLIAIPGDDCQAIWVLAHANDNSDFKAYKITATGIDTPVISAAGNLSGIAAYMDGKMCISPDGTKLAAASNVGMPEGLGLEIYDFDRSTGVVSNTVTLDTLHRNYGVAFSPDGSKLYVTTTPVDPQPIILYQYDLSGLATGDGIKKTLIDTISHLSSYVTPLRLAPDGKIYGYGGDSEFVNHIPGWSSYAGADSIFRINFPDSAGSACDLELNVMGFIDSTGASYTLGQTYVKPAELNPMITVSGFDLSTTVSYVTYQWLLNGKIIPGATDSVYTVSENGDYQVIVTNENGCVDTSGIYTVTNVNGISNIDKIADRIIIYPNPARHTIYINSPVKVNTTLVDVAGKTVRVGQGIDHIFVEDLAPGIYFLRLTDEQGRLLKIQKIVKRKS